jgi:hypothetical protein
MQLVLLSAPDKQTSSTAAVIVLCFKRKLVLWMNLSIMGIGGIANTTGANGYGTSKFSGNLPYGLNYHLFILVTWNRL